MIKNYIKIALRTMWRDRAFSLINLLGLAVGLASVLMITAYVVYELSYDSSYSNASNVYRIDMISPVNGTLQERARVPVALGPTLKKEFPAINAYCVVNNTSIQFKYGSGLVMLDALNASADFFKVFNFKLIAGNYASALTGPNSVVISESMANKYFGGINAIGKVIDAKFEKLPLKITGIMKDIPANTHFKGDAIISMEGARFMNPVLNMQAFTAMPGYVLLNSGNAPSNLEAQFKSIYKKYGFGEIAIQLMPVRKIHLYAHTSEEMMPNGDIKYIYIFCSIAILILLIACINYINMATARSINRAREIGVRKVLGAIRKQLIAQFLSESFLFFTICLVLGLILADACWPVFSTIIDPEGRHIPLFDTAVLVLIPVIILIFGLLSGLYPAFILSKVKTAQVLKGVNAFGINISFRKTLVIMQFVISVVLIVSTIVIYQQLDFVKNARLGFDKEHLIVVPYMMANSHVDAFKNELRTNNNIKGITVASWKAGNYFGESAAMRDTRDTSKMIQIEFINTDPDFISTLGINIIHGRSFSRNYASDIQNVDSLTSKIPDGSPQYKKIVTGRSIIMNEEALKTLGMQYHDNIVMADNLVQGTVVGLAENFNGLTLHEKIPAVIIKCSPSLDFGYMYIRLSPANTSQTLAFIKKKWTGFYPGQTFDFSFVDEQLQKLYSADKRVGQLFGTFAILGVNIACLGLFGLMLLTVQQKVKEIGIRKVLGASIANITAMLSTDFLKMVLIAIVIGSPIAWYAMHKWLEAFAYRIEIRWWWFVLAGILAVLIAFATVSFQAIKAAMANPVKSLRSE